MYLGISWIFNRSLLDNLCSLLLTFWWFHGAEVMMLQDEFIFIKPSSLFIILFSDLCFTVLIWRTIMKYQILEFTFWNRLNRFAMWPHGFAKPPNVQYLCLLSCSLSKKVGTSTSFWEAVNGIIGRPFPDDREQACYCSMKKLGHGTTKTLFPDMHRGK